MFGTNSGWEMSDARQLWSRTPTTVTARQFPSYAVRSQHSVDGLLPDAKLDTHGQRHPLLSGLLLSARARRGRSMSQRMRTTILLQFSRLLTCMDNIMVHFRTCSKCSKMNCSHFFLSTKTALAAIQSLNMDVVCPSRLQK